jgi:hypothetical protein
LKGKIVKLKVRKVKASEVFGGVHSADEDNA